MPRLVYACRFEVATKNGIADVLDAYGAWVQRHYRERRRLDGFTVDLKLGVLLKDPLPKHSLVLDRFKAEKGTAYRLEWAFPADNDDGLVWRNEVRIGEFSGRSSIEHLVWIDSTTYTVAPFQFLLGSPSVVRDLCVTNTGYVGDMQIRATPYILAPNGMGDFLPLLRSPLRKLPIVFLSPYADGDPNIINAPLLARRLACVGVVVTASSIDVTWDLADELGRTLSCFDGAARIYWPGFGDGDDPRRHPLYLGGRIFSMGAGPVSRAIERSLFAVASFRFVPDSRISEIIDSAQQAERAKRVEAEKESTGIDWESYALEIDADLVKAKQAISELQAENENLKANQQVFFAAATGGEEDEVVNADEIVVPDSVVAAVKQAQSKHAQLTVLESAIEAAGQCPYRRPAEISEALNDLNDIAVDWAAQRKSKGSGGDLRQHLIKRGWGKRCSLHVSDTTKKKYASSYTFDYNGTKMLFEPHITIGSGDPNSCASIHFVLDEKAEKIVVAHVGRHLPNTKT